MTLDDCFQLGYIIKPHGLKGELQLFLDVDSPSDYRNLESVFVRKGQQLVPFFIESLQVGPTKAIVAFEDIVSLEQAEELRGLELYLPLSFLPAAGANEFYLHEIESFIVVNQEGQPLGAINNIVESGPQLIFVIENEQGVEILLPYQKQLLIRIDRENKEIHLTVPEGLVEVYTNPTDEN